MKIRNILILAIVVMSFTDTMGQDVIPTNEEGKAEYQEVMEVPGISPNDLYDRGIAWIQKYYKNPSGVLKVEDKDGSVIEAVARFKLSKTDKKGNVNPNAGFVSYTLKFELKDGKYRYTINGIRWEQSSYYDVSQWTDETQNNYDAETFNSYISQTVAYFDELIESLETYMRVGEAEKSDDW